MGAFFLERDTMKREEPGHAGRGILNSLNLKPCGRASHTDPEDQEHTLFPLFTTFEFSPPALTR